MSKKPLISIIVPVHNTENYVARTVESLQKQTIWDDIEVILVENGSTDRSPELCREFAAADPDHIRWMVSDKVGLSEARNAGLERVRGEYVMFVDSDDFIDPEMCGTLLKAKIEHNADVAICNFLLDFEDGATKHHFADTGEVSVLTPEQCAYNTIMEIHTSSSCVRLYDRGFFDKRRFPEGVYFEDHDTVYRWMSEMKRIVYVDSPFYHYYMRETGITHTAFSSVKKLEDCFNAEAHRILFITGYPQFSVEQKRLAVRHVVAQMLQLLKSCITLESKKRNPYESELLGNMRRDFLNLTGQAGMSLLGRKLTIKRLTILLDWKHFVKRHSCRSSQN